MFLTAFKIPATWKHWSAVCTEKNLVQWTTGVRRPVATGRVVAAVPGMRRSLPRRRLHVSLTHVAQVCARQPLQLSAQSPRLMQLSSLLISLNTKHAQLISIVSFCLLSNRRPQNIAWVIYLVNFCFFQRHSNKYEPIATIFGIQAVLQ